MRFRSNVDKGHKEIGRALVAHTWAKDMRQLGGCGYDWLARHVITGAPRFLEVKRPDGPPSGRKLTETEEAMRAAFPDYFVVVISPEEALAAVGVKA